MAKATKEEADYTRCGTEAAHCGICTMFRRPDSCTAVQGKISPEGHCKYFEKRKRPSDQS